MASTTMNRALKQWRLIFTFAGVAGAAACAEPIPDTAADLDAAMDRWEANGFANYSMLFGRGCTCVPGELVATLHIEADSVVSFEDVVANQQPTNDSLLAAWNISLSSFESVEGLFGIIASAIEQSAFYIGATYHAELGFPEAVNIDYSVRVADDEITYIASDIVEEP